MVISGRAEGGKGPAHRAKERVPVGQRRQSKAAAEDRLVANRPRFNDDSPLPFQPMGSAAMGAIRTQARHVRAGAPKWYDTSLCGAAAACGRIFAR